MKLLSNYHTHTKLCGHAIGMSEDYVIKAIQLGLKEIGISDHGPIPRGFFSDELYLDFQLDRQMNEVDFLNTYIKDVLNTKKKYENQIKVYLGLEIEYVSGNDNYYQWLYDQTDYLSLGQHYFRTRDSFYNTYYPMDSIKIMDYANDVAQALDTGFFKILNHPDLFLMFYNEAQNYFFDETAREASKIIIESAIRNKVYLEVNSGGLRKGRITKDKYNRYLYPRYDFWKIVESYPEALVVQGSDAHNPNELLDESVKKAYLFAQQFYFCVVNKIDMKKPAK